MPMCIVKGCTNRSSMKTHRQEMLEETMKITFHMVPKSGTQRQLWLNTLGLNESCLPKQAVVCSRHFRSEDFDRTSLSRTRLKAQAVPSTQAPENAGAKGSGKYTEVSEGLSSCLCLLLKQESNDNLDIFSEPAERSVVKSEKCSMDSIISSESLEKVPRIIPPSKSECLQTLLQRRDESVQVRVPCVDKSTSVSPERLFHSPGKDALRAHIAELKRKHQRELKVLKQKYRRCTEKMENLKTTLQILEKKNLSRDEDT